MNVTPMMATRKPRDRLFLILLDNALKTTNSIDFRFLTIRRNRSKTDVETRIEHAAPYTIGIWHNDKRLQSVPVGDVCMSVVTKAELLYGVVISPRRAQDAAALAAFLPYVEALDLTDNAAIHYAEIRADLKKRGKTKG